MKIDQKHMHLQILVLGFILFCSGIAIGMSLGFILKDFSFNFGLRHLSAITIKPLLSPGETLHSGLVNATKNVTSDGPRKHVRVGLGEYLKAPSVEHDMEEQELLWRASMDPLVHEYPFARTPKVAFLFLTKGKVTFAPLWDNFFKGHDGLFSIYVHTNPSFNATYPSTSVFQRRTIPSKQVQWGEFNMLEAERRLLANALLDISNQRLVLLSESCIPIFNFTTVYNYLINATQSFVEVYDQQGPVGRGRYNYNMSPKVTLDQWRKGSQWFEMDRGLAVRVVSDTIYIPIFQKFCRPACYVDEHYIPTFVHINFPEKSSKRTLTWVDWSRGGPHPTTFGIGDVTVEFLERLRSGTNCEYNGSKTNVCFLFARKFAPETLGKLLMLAPQVMHFG